MCTYFATTDLASDWFFSFTTHPPAAEGTHSLWDSEQINQHFEIWQQQPHLTWASLQAIQRHSNALLTQSHHYPIPMISPHIPIDIPEFMEHVSPAPTPNNPLLSISIARLKCETLAILVTPHHLLGDIHSMRQLWGIGPQQQSV